MRVSLALGCREAIALAWLGFVDAQSGIVSYEWCLSTSASKCDLVAYQSVGLADSGRRVLVLSGSGND